jgi:hypothetical protein
MKQRLTTLLQRLNRLWQGEEGNSSQRIIESVLPVASLYGVDIANIEPEWFRDKTTR